jgi:hypothetical protein
MLLPAACAFAIGQSKYIATTPAPGALPIVQSKTASSIYVDSADWPGVVRAAGDLQADVERVTGLKPAMVHDEKGAPILVGTIGKSALIDRLIKEGKIDTKAIAGKWESFLIQVVAKPLPNVPSALVIAGSDKRGTIFGIYDVSEQIGVSPWYWWADVPVPQQDALFVKAGTRYVQGPPAVKYRGIFLNDEAPALTGWTKEKFGGYNSQFYVKVFELVLRMKGNFMWPAMWGSAFNEDDQLNPKLADEYGIVMSTSHHEPMLRAQQEWKRHGQGAWDYNKNGDFLRQFWSEGVERNKNYESIITLAMRGDGDMPMAGNPADNVALLEKIVADQRKIIAEKVNPDPTKVPQVWALYKEVQGYYERGMRVPDDVTLLWSDDNWGDLRRLPTPDERKRSGGAGIYYHFDYVGGPRNYKWLNTNPVPKVWEQMSLAYQYGTDRIWIVNVGDLKPMEFPIEFFLTLAWNPPGFSKEHIAEYTHQWAEREFGAKYAKQIGDMMATYGKYAGRRKPELIDPATYSIVDYNEADHVVLQWEALTAEAENLSRELPPNARDAFYQLILFPIKASAQVTELYIAAARNKLYAAQGRASANDWAAKVKQLFQADADICAYYNHTLANGKWDHMMDQTHIGYTFWQEPRQNNMPAVKEIELPATAGMKIAVEGSAAAWPGAEGEPALPVIDAFTAPKRYIDVFNTGQGTIDFSAKASDPWIQISGKQGVTAKEQRLLVGVDFTKAPKGSAAGTVIVSRAGGETVTVKVASFNPQDVTPKSLQGFVEAGGVVSMEATHYTRKIDASSVRWDKIDDLGRTLSSMAIFPFTAASATPPASTPCLEYRMYLFDSGKLDVDAVISPSLDFVPGRGLRFAVSFDDQTPKVINALEHNTQRDWETTVKDAVRHVVSSHEVAAPGYHTLKIWMVDPGVVLQKVVVNLGGLKPSYLGPPESFHGGSF